MSNNIHAIQTQIGESTNNHVESYNTVFRQLSSNLIIASGILLALSTQLTGQLQSAEFAIRLLAAGIVISLTLSIAFGVVQQLLEAEYFRRHALKRINLNEEISTGKLSNYEKIEGKYESLREQMGKAVTRWASIVQLVLLALALSLIIATVIVYLFI